MITKIWAAMCMGMLCALFVPQLVWADATQDEQDEADQQTEVQQPEMMSGMMGKMMGMHRRGMMTMPDMTALMELDPEQRTSYLTLLTKSQKQFLDIREQLLLTRIELHEVMTAQKFDKAKAAELAKKQAGLEAQRLQNKLDLAIELRAMGLSCETISHLGQYSMPHRAGKPGMMRRPRMRGKM